jgi:hypothetical protein
MLSPELHIPSLNGWRWRAQTLLHDSDYLINEPYPVNRTWGIVGVSYFFDNLGSLKTYNPDNEVKPEVNNLDGLLKDLVEVQRSIPKMVERRIKHANDYSVSITNVDEFFDILRTPFYSHFTWDGHFSRTYSLVNNADWMSAMKSIIQATQSGELEKVSAPASQIHPITESSLSRLSLSGASELYGRGVYGAANLYSASIRDLPLSEIVEVAHLHEVIASIDYKTSTD